MKLDLTKEQIDDIIKEVNIHESGNINYSEFLAATISLPSFLTEERIWVLFKQFDISDSNQITKEDIK